MSNYAYYNVIRKFDITYCNAILAHVTGKLFPWLPDFTLGLSSPADDADSGGLVSLGDARSPRFSSLLATGKPRGFERAL